jgi:hypothetical protein
VFERHKPRYMTKRISKELSKDHLLCILHYLDQYEGQLEDYLQVFEFYLESNQQWLIQRQEVPDRETTIFVGEGVAKSNHFLNQHYLKSNVYTQILLTQ